MNKKMKPLKKKQDKKELKRGNTVSLPDIPVWLPMTVFTLFTLIFFWDILIGNSFFWEDFIEYVYPVQSFAAVEFSNGIIPFWNPYSFMGMPFLADLQVGFFYPLNRILTLFISNGSLSVWAVEFMIIIHFFIAQLCFYILGRYFKISSIGSMIGAVSYTFSMLLVCHVIHPMIVIHLAWLPLILKFFVEGLDSGKLTKSIFAGLILGMTMLSGHPQMTLYIGLLLGLVFIWNLIAAVKKDGLKGIRPFLQIAGGALPIIIAIGIFSIQYLPSVKLAEQSQRNETTYEKAVEGSLEFKSIYLSVVPGILGNVTGNAEEKPTYYNKVDGSVQTHFFWETAFYFGVTALFLGFFGVLRLYKTRTGAMLLFLSVFAFLFALGRDGVVFNLMYNLPFFGTFRNPGRIMFFVILSFSLLAGFGFDELWKNIKESGITKLMLSAAAFPLLISFLTAVGFLPNAMNAPEELVSEISGKGGIALFLILAVFGIAYSINRSFLTPMIGGFLLVAAAFIDLSLAGITFNQGSKNPKDIYNLQTEMKELFVPNSSEDLFRVNTRIYKPVSFTAMQRNQGMLSRIHQVEGYNPLVLQKAAIYSVDEKTSFDISNVKYQVKVDMQSGSWNYAERTSYMSRAWMVFNSVVVREDEAVEFMKKNVVDYNNSVVINKESKLNLSGRLSDSVNHTVKITEYLSNEISFDVTTEEPGILCISEIWYPDWKAYVDGEETEIFQAYNSFRAIDVPSGSHKIKLVYDSSEYSTGKLISIITILLSIIGWFVLTRFEKKKEIPKQD